MTIREAGSVLLIIGAAVIGPIEGHLKPYIHELVEAEQVASYTKCIRQNDGSAWSFLGARTGCYQVESFQVCGPTERLRDNCLVVAEITERETTTQTCARAMKEIGAGVAGKFADGTMAQPGLMWRNFNNAREIPTGTTHVNGHPVLCIPAPTGLR